MASIRIHLGPIICINIIVEVNGPSQSIVLPWAVKLHLVLIFKEAEHFDQQAVIILVSIKVIFYALLKLPLISLFINLKSTHVEIWTLVARMLLNWLLIDSCVVCVLREVYRRSLAYLVLLVLVLLLAHEANIVWWKALAIVVHWSRVGS